MEISETECPAVEPRKQSEVSGDKSGAGVFLDPKKQNTSVATSLRNEHLLFLNLA